MTDDAPQADVCADLAFGDQGGETTGMGGAARRGPTSRDRGASRKARERKAKHLAKRERMGRIIELYLDGRTDEEIAAVLGLGLTGAMVRKFALDHELTVTRGDKLRRALTIDRLQERSLRRVAEDCDVPPGALLAELVAIALEEDGHVARRLLHVGKREGARAGAAA